MNNNIKSLMADFSAMLDSSETELSIADKNLIAAYGIVPNSGDSSVIYQNSPIIPSAGAIWSYIENNISFDESNLVHKTEEEYIIGYKDFSTNESNSNHGIRNIRITGMDLGNENALSNSYLECSSTTDVRSSEVALMSVNKYGDKGKVGLTLRSYEKDSPDKNSIWFSIAQKDKYISYGLTKKSDLSESIENESPFLVTGNAVYNYIKDNNTSVLNQSKQYTDSVAKGALIWKGKCSFAELPTDARVGDFWTVSDKSNSEFAWNGTEWYDIGAITDLTEVNNKLDELEKKIPKPFDDSNVVHKTGTEEISGAKKFYDNITFGLDATHNSDSTSYGDSETAGRAWLCCRRAYKSTASSLYYDSVVNPNKSNSSKMTEMTIGTGGYKHKRGGAISIFAWEDDEDPTTYPEEGDTRFAFYGAEGPQGGADWCIWLTKDSNDSSAIAEGSKKLVTGNAVYNYIKDNTGGGSIDETNLVHKKGDETIGGWKTFSSPTKINDSLYLYRTANDTEYRTTLNSVIQKSGTTVVSNSIKITPELSTTNKTSILATTSTQEANNKVEISVGGFIYDINKTSTDKSCILHNSNVIPAGSAVCDYVESKLNEIGIIQYEPSDGILKDHKCYTILNITGSNLILPMIQSTSLVVIVSRNIRNVKVSDSSGDKSITLTGDGIYYFMNKIDDNGNNAWTCEKVATQELSFS